MSNRGRALTYVLLVVIGVGLIGWLTGRYLVKRQLVRSLGSTDMEVRVPAARKLLDSEKLEDTLPAQPIITRSKTAEALGEIGTDEAIRVLGVILRDQEEAPRRWARQALVKQGRRAISTLMAALPVGGGTLEETVTALEAIGPTAVPQLRPLLSDRSAYKGASQGLSKLGPTGAAPLIMACYTVDNDLRVAVLGDLGLEKIRAAIPAARANLKTDMSQADGIKALGQLGARVAVTEIIPFLIVEGKRIDAATALGLIGDLRGVEPILATMAETDKGYREAAVVALRRIVRKIGPASYPPLLRDLKAPNPWVRRAAAGALVAATTASLNAPLEAALQDPDSEVRASAALALGWPANTPAVGALVAVATDPAWRVVDAAVKALGNIGTPAIGPLLAVLAKGGGEQQATLHYQIARAFMALGREAVPTLISALGDPSPEVQKWAAVALGGIRDQRAVAPLEKLAKSASGDLKWVAEDQLRVLAGTAGS
jgi:HEAT repeat protein